MSDDNIKQDESVPEGVAQIVNPDGTVETLNLGPEIVPNPEANDAKVEAFVRHQLAGVLGHQSVQKPMWKLLLGGALRPDQPRLSRSWHNGQLITTEERNKLSWQEVHDSNNIVRRKAK